MAAFEKLSAQVEVAELRIALGRADENLATPDAMVTLTAIVAESAAMEAFGFTEEGPDVEFSRDVAAYNGAIVIQVACAGHAVDQIAAVEVAEILNRIGLDTAAEILKGGARA